MNVFVISKDEDIDGSTFCKLNAILLHQIGVRMGSAITLQRVIQEAEQVYRYKVFLLL